MGDWLGSGGTTISLVLDCEGFPGFFDVVTETCLGPAVTLGADFAVLSFLLVLVTSLRLLVTGGGSGMGSAGGVALTTQLPRTTWILVSPARQMAPLDSPSDRQDEWVHRPPYCVQQASA